MKFRWSFFRIGVFIIPFLLSLHFVFAQNQILSHIPPPNGIIGQDLILSASTLENSDQLDATLYYRLPGSESYQEIPFQKNGFNWEATIPGFGLTVDGLEYVVAFQFWDGRIASFPTLDPFNEPHFLNTIPPENQIQLSEFGELPPAEVLILSPEPNEIIDQNSLIIAASFFNANEVDAATVHLLLDGVDVSSKMIYEEGILIYDPGALDVGGHTVEILMKDLDQQDIAPVRWSFIIGAAPKDISELVTYFGNINSRLSSEEVSGNALNIAEIAGDVSLDVKWATLNTNLRLTTRESQYAQPQNRFGTKFIFGNILNMDVGDFYPRISPFTIDGKRVRGIGIDAKVKWVRLQYIKGELNRAVHQQNKINGGYQILADLTNTNEDGSKTYYLDRTGFAFKRKIFGLKMSVDLFPKKILFFDKAGIHFLQIRDDTTSVNRILGKAEFYADELVLGVTPGNYNIDSFRQALAAAGHSLEAPQSHWKGQTPLDNFVIGFNLGRSVDDKKLTFDFDWNMSMFNRDIWDGATPKSDLNTMLADFDIDTDLIPFDPIKFKDIFIMNINMSPFVPIDLNAITKRPISSIINMPSSAFNLRIRGHYSLNNFLIEYRQVGPEFVSLGNPFLRSNTRQFIISDRVSLLDRTLLLNFGFKHLDNKILKSTVNPLNTNTVFLNFTFLPGPSMPSIIVNYQSIGKNNEKTQLDSVGNTLVDLREDSKAATNMMAVTIPFNSGDIKQNLTFNMGNVTNVDQLVKKRSTGYLFPKTDSKTISINLSSTFPSQLKTITQFSRTKLEIPSMDGNKLIKTPYTWTNISISGNYRLLQDKMLAKGTISLLNSQSQIKSQLFGLRAGADYQIRNNLTASIMSQFRLNYIPSYKKDKLDNDGNGKVDNAGEVMEINSAGIILTVQYNF